MARPLRILKPETCYVVSHQLLDQHRFDQDEALHEAFFNGLNTIPKRYKISLHAYALTPTRYFLYLKAHKGNLDQFMHQLHLSISQSLGKRTHFKNRYRAVVIEPERYRQAILNYLHTKGSDNSAQYYRENHFPDWLEKLPVTRHEEADARLAEVERFFEKQRWPAILATRSFQHQLRRGGLSSEGSPAYQETLSFEAMIQLVAEHFGCSAEQIKAPSPRGRGHTNLARSCAIKLARDCLAYSLKDIAEHFSLHHPASASHAAKQFEKHLSQYPEQQKHYEQLMKKMRTPAKIC
ncbi:MAG: hypothetical protein COV52_03490 [Gammaproteobacteria bacterium CG11_big_fil_rev_8_21_14_0_20_46_22]|nr:MAG: hypothetical protein COW05_09755 [Gammaproteobacteria bacterium CG12_big_fil_rev_8_21_14_0_65_46_12]PIR11537.1 MAG: hypothetical protein COV52_03490 [Gammaproteobacteria bacterium CG11_big_fil_rev_8_21_14_0_20_46_22]